MEADQEKPDDPSDHHGSITTVPKDGTKEPYEQTGRLVFYALVLVLLVLGVRKTYEFGHDIFYAPGMEALPGTEKTVTLDGTESVADVGKLLEDAGLIRDHVAFSIQAKCYDYEVKKGSFSLNTSQSSKEIINILDEETKKE